MKRNDLILLALPFILSAVIILGHYRIITMQNPKAHSRPLITKNWVQSIDADELSPFPLTSPLPKQIVGVMHEIPTSKKQLNQLLELMQSQAANILFMPIGLTIDENNNLIIPKALESSEEMLIRWVKKTSSDAHKRGFHTYLSLILIENPKISDVNKFTMQLSEFIDRWGSVAQEYHISFFDPGITLGHASFRLLDPKLMQALVTQIEQKTREVYTGRIGIGMCCMITNIAPRGYNQILLISKTGVVSEELQNKAVFDASRNNVEHIFLLNLGGQRISTLK